MRNEKGQTLITVLLVSLIFTVLGLTIVAASINSNQRTGVRIDEIELTTEATKILSEGIAKFTNEVSGFQLQERDIMTFDDKFISIINELENDNFSVTDVSEEKFQIDKSKYFTRIFEFSYINKNTDGAKIAKKITRTVYLSPTPSFLNYAIGSGPDGLVTLNGAADIKGDLFSGDLNTDDTAFFEDANSSLNNPSQKDTLFPRINGNVFLKNKFNNSSVFPSTKEEYDQSFDPESILTVTKDTSEFIDVNFGNTMAQLFNELSYGFTDDMFSNRANVHLAVEQLLKSCGNQLIPSSSFLSTQTEPCENDIQLLSFSLNEQIDFDALTGKINSSNPRTYVYSSPDTSSPGKLINPTSNDYPPLYITKDVRMHDDSWLVVHGDLVIFTKDKTINLQGNILVTGNLIIEGNNEEGTENENDHLQVDSTIYVLGKSDITNTNIKGLDDKQLVLLSQEDILINRINEFKNITDDIEKLDAFFYTQKSAELYGVGSLFLIKGGIFARDNLTVNAIRQNEIEKKFGSDPGKLDLSLSIKPVNFQKSEQSRFQVEQDLKVLADQIDSLPKVDRFQILLDQPVIENTSYEDPSGG
ncbi:hypothetical protein [Metabacillus litoralis]|uniref:hypothetical protein n=1 Tax=Metabacillus litoralis TaxID=152268 RepID=UPI001CFE2E02|nr:hypothetical protein [Metabacillus litoralis]